MTGAELEPMPSALERLLASERELVPAPAEIGRAHV